MPLTLRQVKGTKLSISEMDGNLTYLESIASPSYYDNGLSSVNTNIDWSRGLTQMINIDNNPTLTFSNGVIGETYQLILKQEMIGRKNIIWANDIVWSNSLYPVLPIVPGVGGLDPAFNNRGITDWTGQPRIYGITALSDGKCLVTGNFDGINGYTSPRIIRLNADGSVDTSFRNGTGFNTDSYVARAQSDGKCIVVGNFTTYRGLSHIRIIRLNLDGSVDASFNTGLGFSAYTRGLVIQPDGKILVSGTFTSYNGTTANRIIRLNSDGSIDGSFNTGTGFNSGVDRITILPDGKIVAAGSFTLYNGTTANRIIRLNSDGSIDGSFNTGTGFNNSVFEMATQPDGKVLAGGNFTSYNGTSYQRIIRLNSDGSIDTGFNAGFNNDVYTLNVQSDGKILVGGAFTLLFTLGPAVSVNRFCRLNTDGSSDSSFNDNFALGCNDFVSGCDIQPDGKILVGGAFFLFNEFNRRMVRIYANASTEAYYTIAQFVYDGSNYIGIRSPIQNYGFF